MPQLPKQLLNSVVYLYPSVDAARAGEKFGGTGFLIGVPSENVPNAWFLYVVTNWHIAVRAGCSIIAIRKKGGGSYFFESDPSDWIFETQGDDIAFLRLPIKDLDDAQLEITYCAASTMLTEEACLSAEIGPGDDVFMMGRFVDHDGGISGIRPAVRFGNISVSPTFVSQERPGAKGESFILDMHSRTGFSGSPVFVYRIANTDLNAAMSGDNSMRISSPTMALLGIHWGQFPEDMEITDAPSSPESEAYQVAGKYVRGYSGMTVVLPAWKIQRILDMDRTFRIETGARAPNRIRQGAIAEAAVPIEPPHLSGDEILTNMLNTPPDPRLPVGKKSPKKRRT